MRKLNNEEICKYLIRSGKVKERRERMRQISDCLINFTGEKNGYEPLRLSGFPHSRCAEEGVVDFHSTLRQALAREEESEEIIGRLLICLSVMPQKEQDILMTFYVDHEEYPMAIDILSERWNRGESQILVWRKRAMEEIRTAYNLPVSTGELAGMTICWDSRGKKVNIMHNSDKL